MEHGDPSITIRYVQLALEALRDVLRDVLRDTSGSIPLLIEAARNSRQAEGGRPCAPNNSLGALVRYDCRSSPSSHQKSERVIKLVAFAFRQLVTRIEFFVYRPRRTLANWFSIESGDGQDLFGCRCEQ